MGVFDLFAEAMLQLCQISYDWEDWDIPDYVNQMSALTTGGTWACEWGPQYDWFNTNVWFLSIREDRIFSIC